MNGLMAAVDSGMMSLDRPGGAGGPSTRPGGAANSDAVKATRRCHNCQELGHYKHECKQPPKNNAGGGGAQCGAQQRRPGGRPRGQQVNHDEPTNNGRQHFNFMLEEIVEDSGDGWNTVERKKKSTKVPESKSPTMRVPKGKPPTTTTTTTTTATATATTTRFSPIPSTRVLSPNTYRPSCCIAPSPGTGAAGRSHIGEIVEKPRRLSPAVTKSLSSIHGNTEKPVPSTLHGRGGAASNPSAWTSGASCTKGSTRGSMRRSTANLPPPLHPWESCNRFAALQCDGKDCNFDEDTKNDKDDDQSAMQARLHGEAGGAGRSVKNEVEVKSAKDGTPARQPDNPVALRGCRRSAGLFENASICHENMLDNHEVKNIEDDKMTSVPGCARSCEQKKIGENNEETDRGIIRGAARQAGEHHNPCGDVRLTPFEGRRQHRCGQPVEDLHEEVKEFEEYDDDELTMEALETDRLWETLGAVATAEMNFGRRDRRGCKCS